jgi:hypothetical protein
VASAGTVPFTFHKESSADACPLCAAVRFSKRFSNRLKKKKKKFSLKSASSFPRN